MRLSKKWLNATFSSFTVFASRVCSRAAKTAKYEKYENLRVFIRSDAHVVRAELNISGCGPLSTQGFIDRPMRRRKADVLKKILGFRLCAATVEIHPLAAKKEHLCEITNAFYK